MSSEPPKKRKKKVNKCQNPLFVKWLTEWRDEAAEQGKKTQYAFGKVWNLEVRFSFLIKRSRPVSGHICHSAECRGMFSFICVCLCMKIADGYVIQILNLKS